MTTVSIKPEQLASSLRAEANWVRRQQSIAALGAARRFAAHLANQTDAMGITDTGLLKAGWRAARLPGGRGAVTFNDNPTAGIIEGGARPHKVSKEGRENIARWAVRKLGVDPKRALGVAFLIAKKIAEYGQKPTYMVRDALPFARRYFAEEMIRLLNGRRGAPR